jgi:hypothetical protein
MKSNLLDAAETPAEQTEAIAKRDDAGLVLMFERLAKDPAVDVEKLERLIAMQERIMAHNAKSAFDSAYSRMQPDIPEIDEKGRIVVGQKLRSTYAKLEDIHHVIKPILKSYGFALRHRTEWPSDRPGVIRIVGILSHEQGHSEESAFEAPADKSDFRSDIQSQGSTVSYGRRYTTLDLLNIATRGQDDDGAKSGRPEPPKGYDTWLLMLDSVAKDGAKAYDLAWEQSKPEFRTFIVSHDKEKWIDLKRIKDGRRG